MYSKNKNKEKIDSESREQFEYAQKRVSQKKKLMRHFVTLLAGSILIIILNILGVAKDVLPQDWFIFVILIWLFVFLIHLFNVFITNAFMGKEWENNQLEKLKAQQEKRVAELKKQAMQEVTVKENIIAKEQDALKEMTRSNDLPDVKKNPNQLPLA